jgi:hypothetical protein
MTINLNKLENNLFKYYFLLKKHKSFEAIFSHFDEFSESMQNDLIDMYGQPGQVEAKNNAIIKDILISFKAINSLNNNGYDTNMISKIQSVIISIDNYLNNLFESYAFDETSEEYLLSKYDLTEIINKKFNERRKVST